MNKTIQRLNQQRVRQRGKEQVVKTIAIVKTNEKRKEPKRIYKTGRTHKLPNLKKENGEITREREAILNICSGFNKKLYRSTTSAQ